LDVLSNTFPQGKQRSEDSDQKLDARALVVIVHADEKLTAFMELELAMRQGGELTVNSVE
jgi:hypothetical protein